MEIRKGLENVPLWTRQYLIADPLIKGPPSDEPLRIIPDVADRQLTIHVEPDEAGPPKTRVKLAKARAVVFKACLPPQPNHATVWLPPYPHLVTVESTAGLPERARDSVDVRVTSELRVRVKIGADPAPGRLPTDPLVESKGTPKRGVRGFKAYEPTRLGTLEATALEPETTIRFEGLAPPYQAKEGRRTLRETLPPGPYVVSFRIGSEEFGRKEVYLTAGDELKITPTPFSSQVVRDAIGDARSVDLSSARPSETVGPMQGAVLSTLLPLLGLKAFDPNNTFLHRYEDLVPPTRETLR